MFQDPQALSKVIKKGTIHQIEECNVINSFLFVRLSADLQF